MKIGFLKRTMKGEDHSQEAQLLTSYKLHQLDERLRVVEEQTRTLCQIEGYENLIFIKCMFMHVSFYQTSTTFTRVNYT